MSHIILKEIKPHKPNVIGQQQISVYVEFGAATGDGVNLEKGEGLGSVQQKPYFDKEDGGEIKATASGKGSFAFGKNTTATGTRAVAIGNGCNSAGNTAFTIGQDNITGKEPLMDEDGNVLEWYGSASFTGGNVCTNYGNYTFLFGYKQIANANVRYCFSTGSSNTFLEGAQESGIFGSESKNASIRTYLFGQKNQSLNPSAVNSFTAGFNNTITSNYQFLFGDNLTPRDNQQQIVLGTRNVKDNNAILVVGNGGLQRWEEGYKYHNAFVVKRDGKVYGGELYLTEAENKLVNAKELSETLAKAKAYTDNEIATFDFIKIGNLPETGLINKIYLVPKTSSENNDLFDEYLWVNNTWEFLGTKKVEVDLSDYLQKYKTGGATRFYGVNRQGEQVIIVGADIASAIQTQRVAMYLSDAAHDINKEPNGALVTKTPVKDYQCANKKYVDEAVANAGGGSGSSSPAIIDVEELPTENINTKALYRVFNEDGEQELWYYSSYDEGEYEWQRVIGSNEFFDYIMTDATLSANQQAAVMDLIREYGGGGGSASMEELLQMGFLHEGYSTAWLQLVDDVETLKNASGGGEGGDTPSTASTPLKLYRIEGEAYEYDLMNNTEGESFNFEVVAKNNVIPNMLEECFMDYICPISFRLNKKSNSDFYPIGVVGGGSKVYGFKNGQMHETPDYEMGNISTRNVTITEISFEEQTEE